MTYFFMPKKHTLENFIKEAVEIHGDKYDYSKTDYTNAKAKVRIICPIHGEFWQAPYHHLNGNGCPHCKESLFEKRVAQFFKENRIQYMEHANCVLFPWLHKQHLDFYLPKYNIAIECQGEQHYFPVDFAGKGEEWAINKFKQIQKLDEEKLKLCNENGVKLLYIKFDDDIEVIIKNILKI